MASAGPEDGSSRDRGPFCPIELRQPCVVILDQTRLPTREAYVEVRDVETMCEAIRSLRVRGAPLLGIAGTAGLALAAEADASDEGLRRVAGLIRSTRPTAVDLGFRTDEALTIALAAGGGDRGRQQALWAFAERLLEQQRECDAALAAHGAGLFEPGSAVLTHCNTGALATGALGTALAVIRTGWEKGRVRHCYATETRPLLQGARLTAWELGRLGIPHSLLPDTAAASLLASGRVQAVIVGADRVAANGDTANKIGTYGLAVVAARHRVPFYIAAPTSTIDLSCPDGEAIPIEFRADDEVGGFGEWRWAPPNTPAYNPAFDVTPAELIAAIVTERGVLRPPFRGAIGGLSLIGRGRARQH